MAKMAFLTVNNFYWVFSKIPTKRTFVRLFFLVGFSKTKNTHFRGFKMVLFKSQISNLYFCQTKILIFCPPGIFEHENFDACAPKFWNWTSKIIPDLWLLVLSKKNSTLHPSTQSPETGKFGNHAGSGLSISSYLYEILTNWIQI